MMSILAILIALCVLHIGNAWGQIRIPSICRTCGSDLIKEERQVRRTADPEEFSAISESASPVATLQAICVHTGTKKVAAEPVSFRGGGQTLTLPAGDDQGCKDPEVITGGSKQITCTAREQTSCKTRLLLPTLPPEEEESNTECADRLGLVDDLGPINPCLASWTFIYLCRPEITTEYTIQGGGEEPSVTRFTCPLATPNGPLTCRDLIRTTRGGKFDGLIHTETACNPIE
jgi:hypothetical protein